MGEVSTVALRQETYLPSADGHEVAQVFEFLRAHESRVRQPETDARYFLGSFDAEDRVEVPVEVYRVLRQVVEAMQGGLAVTVVPQSMTLTTQQAADLLGVSRPTLVKLLESDRIPYERVGAHRRLLLRDLLSYRERRREEQYAALAAIAAEEDDDVESVLDGLRDARREIAERRRRSRSA